MGARGTGKLRGGLAGWRRLNPRCYVDGAWRNPPRPTHPLRLADFAALYPLGASGALPRQFTSALASRMTDRAVARMWASRAGPRRPWNAGQQRRRRSARGRGAMGLRRPYARRKLSAPSPPATYLSSSAMQATSDKGSPHAASSQSGIPAICSSCQSRLPGQKSPCSSMAGPAAPPPGGHPGEPRAQRIEFCVLPQEAKKLRERIIAQGKRRETRDRRGVNAGRRFGHRQGLPGKQFRRLYGPAGETDTIKANGFHQGPTGAGRRGQPPRAGCRTPARQGGRCDDRHGSAGRCFRVSGHRSRFRVGRPPPTRPRKAAAHG